MPGQPIAVLGAGTGLGEGFLIHTGQGYQVVPSEGGHTDFDPRNALQMPLPEFLSAISSNDPSVLPYEYLADHALPADIPATLYQPLHGSFYLVTASLVCRQLGLPDRDVNRKNGERTSFVIRRIRDGYEQGWVDDEPDRGWHDLAYSNDVLPNEERLPMHPAATPTGEATLLNGFGRMPCDARTIYHGYLPTGNRKKYIESFVAPSTNIQPTAADDAALVDAYRAQIEQDSSLEDFRLNELDTRVLASWSFLHDLSSSPDPERL